MKKLLEIDLLNLIDELHDHGATCYIVGGFVRDFLLERPAYDIDIEVHMIEPKLFEEIAARHSKFAVQGKFGVYKLFKFDDVEFAIPRIEKLCGNKHTDFLIELDPYLGTKKAAKRRDFTINALMYNLRTGEMIDHFGGLIDLNNKVIRHVSDKFSEDPLRVLRGIRFASELGFSIASETLEVAKSLSLDEIAVERMNYELRRYFLGKYLYETLEDFKYLFGQRYYLSRLDCVPQNKLYHPEGNAWLHTKEAVRVGIEVFKDSTDDVKFIGLTSLLFHDIGKICKIKKEEIAHEELSSRYFKKFCHEITSKKSEIKLINNCILFHMQPRNIDVMDGSSIVLILQTFGSDLQTFLNVTTADMCCRYEKYSKEHVLESIGNYEKNIVWRFFKISKYYNELKNKYNGHYFMDKGIVGSDIKKQQTELFIELIQKYNENLN